MPSTTPDNILIFICNEFTEFILSFFENFEDSKKYFDVLNKYCDVLFYYSVIYSVDNDKEDFYGSPISNVPISNFLFTYNEVNPCYIIKPPISDNLRTEIVEFINNIYSDRSVLQENITLMDPPFYLKGILLTFRGFVVYNSLSNDEFLSLSRTGNLYDIHDRTHNCPEILVCEYLFKNEKLENPSKLINIDSHGGGDTRKRFLATILSQREFSLYISLDILGKSNCSYDPFYQKRAEDILIGTLKRGFGTIFNSELYNFGIKPILSEIKEDEENIFNNFETEENINEINNNQENLKKNSFSTKKIENLIKPNNSSNLPIKKNIPRNNSQNSLNTAGAGVAADKNNSKINNSNFYNSEIKPENFLTNLNSKFKGYIDSETNVNIIQFSCYDDSECVINTTDIYANQEVFQGIYKIIFKEYAKIQTNINKLKNRNKQLKLRKIFNYENVVRNYTNFNSDARFGNNENLNKINFKNEPITKTKITKEYFLRNLNAYKINEYAIKFSPEDNLPIWITCKIYEHTIIGEETNLDEFSNFKIIFVSYESVYPVDVDSFCQDLLINEYFN